MEESVEPTVIAVPPRAAPPPSVEALARSWLHENLVLYNPLYLFSAALVLGGLVLLLCEPALESELGGLVISALAEIYALALIGGAAMLVRGNERRAAVMLGLLTLVFQCDLTLHVERSALMGAGGAVAGLVWLALFHLKIGLLARALELRLDRATRWLPTLGAAALALLPRALPTFELGTRGSIVAFVVFVLVSLAVELRREVESRVAFDVRGRRSLVAAWTMLGAGFALHVLDWAVETRLPVGRIVPALFLVTLRSPEIGERRVFGSVLLALAVTAVIDAEGLSVVALMSAAALVLRALRKPVVVEALSVEPSPYRFGPGERIEVSVRRTTFARAPIAERERMLVASAAALHLSAWSAMTPHGIPHEHVVALDVALAAVAIITLASGRRWTSIVPALVVVADLFVELGWLRVPRGAGEAGAWALVSGFALLALGLRVSLRSRPLEDDQRMRTCGAESQPSELMQSATEAPVMPT